MAAGVLLLLLVVLAAPHNARADHVHNIRQGDLAILALEDAAGAAADSFTFVMLNDLPVGTDIYFSGWRWSNPVADGLGEWVDDTGATVDISDSGSGGQGHVVYTVQSGDVQGTVVHTTSATGFDATGMANTLAGVQLFGASGQPAAPTLYAFTLPDCDGACATPDATDFRRPRFLYAVTLVADGGALAFGGGDGAAPDVPHGLTDSADVQTAVSAGAGSAMAYMAARVVNRLNYDWILQFGPNTGTGFAVAADCATLGNNVDGNAACSDATNLPDLPCSAGYHTCTGSSGTVSRGFDRTYDSTLGEFSFPGDCTANDYYSSEFEGFGSPDRCFACDPSCDGCTGFSADDCVACTGTNYLNSGTCSPCDPTLSSIGDCAADGEYYRVCGGYDDEDEYTFGAVDRDCVACSTGCFNCDRLGVNTDSTALGGDACECQVPSHATAPLDYFVDAGTSECTACAAACSVGTEYELTGCTDTTDRDCQACSTCAAGAEYDNGGCDDGVADRDCQPCSSCIGDDYDDGSGCTDGGAADTSCSPCTTCGPNEYEVTGCRAGGDGNDRVCGSCDGACDGCTGPTDTDCTACAAGHYLDGVTGACTVISTCDAGTEYEVSPPDANNDRDCDTCAAACTIGVEFESTACGGIGGTDDRVCTTCDTCDPGEYDNGGCDDGTDDRDCQPCSTCSGDDYDDGSGCAATDDTACVPCTTCGGDEFEVTGCREGGDGNDRVCAPCDSACNGCSAASKFDCDACAPHFFLDGDTGACEPVSVCDGEVTFEVTAPTPTTDRECAPVRQPCDAAQEYEEHPPTPWSDRVCVVLDVCKASGEYAAVEATPSSGRVCAGCHPACAACDGPTASGCLVVSDGAGGEHLACSDDHWDDHGVCTHVSMCHSATEYMSAAATPTSDAECRACHDSCDHGGCHGAHATDCLGGCAHGWWLDDMGTPADAGDDACKPVSACDAATEYIAALATGSSDTQCGPCDGSCGDGGCSGPGADDCVACAPGYWQDHDGSGGDCVAFTVCDGVSEYEVQPPSPHHDRVCAPLSHPCQPGTYTLRHASPTRDRICAPCHTGCEECAGHGARNCLPHACAGDYYYDAIAGGVCYPARGCDTFDNNRGSMDGSEWEVSPPTPTSDAVCAPVSQCYAVLEYETVAPTATSDRGCAELTWCDADSEFEAAPPTPISDRVCGSCYAGCLGCSGPTAADCAMIPKLGVPACRDGYFADVDSGECAPLTPPCDSGGGGGGATEYEAAAPTRTSDRVCMPLTTCDAATQFVAVAPTATSDAQCGACSARCDGVAGCSGPGADDCAACGLGLAPDGSGVCCDASGCDPATQYVAQECTPDDASPGACGACDARCDGCSGPTSFDCDACADTWTRHHDTGNCVPCDDVSSCSTITRADGSQGPGYAIAACSSEANVQCGECHPACAACDGPGADDCLLTSCAEGHADPGNSGTCCPSGQYSDAPGSCAACDAACDECTAAGPGACIACADAGQVGGYWDDAGTCTAVTACVPQPDGTGQYASATATPTSDTVCANVRVCGEQQWEAVAPTATSNRECLACNEACDGCSGGATAAHCNACKASSGAGDPGYFPDAFSGAAVAGPGHVVCKLATTCDAWEYESAPATATSDAECRAVRPPCDGVSEYETAAPTATSDRQCSATTACVAAAEYVSVPATPTSDRQCEAYSSCDPATQYQTAVPTASSDRVCADLTVCDPDQEYESQAPTPVADRVCTPLTECVLVDPALAGVPGLEALAAQSQPEYESQAPEYNKDRVCSPVTQCGEREWAQIPPTPTTDRVCSEWRQCSGHEYQTAAPTATSNRACASLRVCTAGEWESTAATATSNRVCSSCLDCADAIELSPCWSHGDTTCQMQAPVIHWDLLAAPPLITVFSPTASGDAGAGEGPWLVYLEVNNNAAAGGAASASGSESGAGGSGAPLEPQCDGSVGEVIAGSTGTFTKSVSGDVKVVACKANPQFVEARAEASVVVVDSIVAETGVATVVKRLVVSSFSEAPTARTEELLASVIADLLGVESWQVYVTVTAGDGGRRLRGLQSSGGSGGSGGSASGGGDSASGSSGGSGSGSASGSASAGSSADGSASGSASASGPQATGAYTLDVELRLLTTAGSAELLRVTSAWDEMIAQSTLFATLVSNGVVPLSATVRDVSDVDAAANAQVVLAGQEATPTPTVDEAATAQGGSVAMIIAAIVLGVALMLYVGPKVQRMFDAKDQAKMRQRHHRGGSGGGGGGGGGGGAYSGGGGTADIDGVTVEMTQQQSRRRDSAADGSADGSADETAFTGANPMAGHPSLAGGGGGGDGGAAAAAAARVDAVGALLASEKAQGAKARRMSRPGRKGHKKKRGHKKRKGGRGGGGGGEGDDGEQMHLSD